MKAIDLIKLAIPNLDMSELMELNKLIIEKTLTPLDKEIREIWVERGKIPAVKHYHYYEGHKKNPTLIDSREYVDALCSDIKAY